MITISAPQPKARRPRKSPAIPAIMPIAMFGYGRMSFQDLPEKLLRSIVRCDEPLRTAAARELRRRSEREL